MSVQSRVLSGRYRVDDLIGRGGMASVYRGEDLTLGRAVAIKLLEPDLAADGAFRTRFRLEAQSASRMSHPAIVRVFDAGEETRTDAAGRAHPEPYIVMELVTGRLLKDIIAEGPVPLDDALRYTDGILEALEYSHRAGVVHRDIKPGNVMVTDAGQVKVMDFGIARAVSDSSSTVAETTNIIGTASYFSPEMAKGDPVDARADIYSAGIVLYELLTGRPPFRGENPIAVAYQHVSEAPVPPSEVTDAAPRSLDALVLRALAKDPFQRPQTAVAFRDALASATGRKAPSKRRVESLSNELYGPDPRQAAETARSLRQLTSDDTMRRTQAGPPVAWVWAGIAMLAVLLLSVFIWVNTIRPDTEAISPNVLKVPDIVTMTWDRAEEVLADEELQAQRATEASAEIPEGAVIRTDPLAGTTVAPGDLITVYVSSGVETSTVPTLENLTLQEATTALEDAGLRLGSVTRRNDPKLSADIVISATAGGSSVTDGSELPEDTAVDVVISSGTVTVEDFALNYSVDKAVEILESEDYGLTPVVVEDPSCPATDPRMVKVQSAIGEVPVRSEITLTTCSG
ncbi:Stk1 family PASTA domain-containing Ser/Thr kinase [Microbacterium sp. EYE_5]|uniref:Stk1 family PASTA domain-containing Ser/Thr kinase n=1 Tax=unclassified Microbacterium TaxID=2609290 RepID=UPI0027E01B05|nr:MULTISPECIES: Stk1 family PASTA domain-containing Ser/Thr kinase [unclassified Microbacterium]MCK6079608.1 Stk1 family PASTA domain-containing Ser/Thr kinase [Microbacterium sp. EYE_382]MCK6084879.1 Stk1 family PASTA domain-containing Ser/Thr kinase [Microbacterium sp. EYE_384]MCK6122895.1 Stk1 family PASTA domain-containing Ser/Thr kinase [Microbacterium sp. EYE_80]MCK6125642.1 Stk1 family PASTA domain-containing Ser/Thr kinase [Microbacterium sp. EYE_79]MCK6140563.1 Stk1 family PASTA doma